MISFKINSCCLILLKRSLCTIYIVFIDRSIHYFFYNSVSDKICCRMWRPFLALKKLLNIPNRITKGRPNRDNSSGMAGLGSGSFRYTVWDPFMIIAQMATLQSLYYVSLGVWIFIFDTVQGSPRSLDQIFKYQVSYPIYYNRAKLPPSLSLIIK